MTISDSTTDKLFGSNVSTKNIAIYIIANIIGNDYNSSFIHSSQVDTINFEIRCTDIAANVLEIINPYLRNFKLELMMKELPSITAIHGGSS